MTGDEKATRRVFIAREPHECKEQAEAILTAGNANGNAARAIGWALLAIAAELHSLRKEARRENRRSR